MQSMVAVREAPEDLARRGQTEADQHYRGAGGPLSACGPDPDCKEQLGGFFTVDVPELDTALEWAACDSFGRLVALLAARGPAQGRIAALLSRDELAGAVWLTAAGRGEDMAVRAFLTGQATKIET